MKVFPAFLRQALRLVPNLSLVITPLAALPLILGPESTPESKCIYLIIMMGVFWSLNPIPLPITSLLPIVMLPLLGLESTEKACGAYLRSNNMLFFGCLTLALAVEKSKLHQRIALKVLSSVSAKLQWILLGFMATTMFFSMWIVSTATVAMMLPIADEIFKNIFSSFDEMKKNKQQQQQPPDDHDDNDNDPFYQTNNNNNGNDIRTISNEEAMIGDDDDQLDRKNRRDSSPDSFLSSKEDQLQICKKFYLCIAYSATIGGVSTITSNGPNLVMKDVLENKYQDRDPVDYATWIMFATPVSVLICFILWAIFSCLYFRKVSISPSRQVLLRRHITKKYQRLGPITFHEWAVLFVFTIMIMLYTFYKPHFVPGWSTLFPEGSTSTPKSASAAILCVIILFLVPAKPRWGSIDLKREALLDWHTIQTRLEWGVLIIRGGGFAMADAVEISGLSKMVGHRLSDLSHILSLPALIAFISATASIVIEFMRTSSTAAILFPVAIKLAEVLNINPLRFVIPCATACAYGFISPVGTTSNTLIFYHANLRIRDMIVPGLIAKFVAVTLMMANTFLFGEFYFDINNNYPDWINATTITTTTIATTTVD